MSHSVLIMEHDASRREALDGALRSLGFTTQLAGDPMAAMKVVRGRTVDVVLLSAKPDPRAVRGICQLARRRQPDVRICVVDAPDDRQDLSSRIPGGCAFIDAGEPGPIVARVAEGVGAPVQEKVVAEPVTRSRVIDNDGAAHLVHLAGQGLTGFVDLRAEDPPFSRLWMQEGLLVWAAPRGGDRALYQRLVNENMLLSGDPVEPVPEGRLLGDLFTRGIIASVLVTRMMRALLDEAALGLFDLASGVLDVVEDATAAGAPPLVKLDAFGMIFKHIKTTMDPDALLRLSRTMRPKTVTPLPGLAAMVERVRPFLQGHDATEVVDGGTIDAFNQRLGHDDLLGVTLVIALERAGLCRVD